MISVTIFHDLDVKSKAGDNKRLTLRKDKGKETLHIKDDKKEMSGSIEVKNEVRKPKRLTLHNENIVSTRPDVSEMYGRHEGNKAPNSTRHRK